MSKEKSNTGKTLLIVGGVALATLLVYPKIKEDLKNALSGAIPDLSGFFDAISGGIGNLGGALSGITIPPITIPDITIPTPTLDLTAITDLLTKFLPSGGGVTGGDTTTEVSWWSTVKGEAVKVAEFGAIVGAGYVGLRYLAPPAARATGGVIENLASKLFATRTTVKTAKVVSAGDMGVEALGPASATKGFPLKYGPEFGPKYGWFARLLARFRSITPALAIAPVLGPSGTWREPLIKIPGLNYPTGAAPGWLQAISFNMPFGVLTESGGGGGGYTPPNIPWIIPPIGIGGGGYQPSENQTVINYQNYVAAGGVRAPYAITAPPHVKVSGHPTEKEKSAFYAYYKAHGGV